MARPHAALLTALALFGLAAAVLVVDTLWGVDALLEGRAEDGAWRAMAESGGDDAHGYPAPIDPLRARANTTTQMRLTIVNDRPVGFDETVRVSLGEWPPVLLKEERVRLGPFERTEIAFKLNATRLPSYAPYPAREARDGGQYVTSTLLVTWDEHTERLPVAFEVYEP